MAERSDNPPIWARRSVEATPDLWVHEPVGQRLPPWMRDGHQAWLYMRKAHVPHPGRWVRTESGEALNSLKAARRTLIDAIAVHVKKHLLGSVWRASQAELESALCPLPAAPKGHRFVLHAGVEEADMMDSSCTYLPMADAILRIEAWKEKDLVEATPAPILPQLCYWIAHVQATIEVTLMVLTTDRDLGVNLARPGPVTVWVHGLEETLNLPVAAALLDPGDSRLGHVIAYCQHHGLILPAFRPPETSHVRTDLD